MIRAVPQNVPQGFRKDRCRSGQGSERINHPGIVPERDAIILNRSDMVASRSDSVIETGQC